MTRAGSIEIRLGTHKRHSHYHDVIMDAMASQITSLTIVYSTVYSDADQRKHQSSASLAFVRGIHRGPVNSPQKWSVTRKMSPFHDVIMITYLWGRIMECRFENFGEKLCYKEVQVYSLKPKGAIWHKPWSPTITSARNFSQASLS